MLDTLQTAGGAFLICTVVFLIGRSVTNLLEAIFINLLDWMFPPRDVYGRTAEEIVEMMQDANNGDTDSTKP